MLQLARRARGHFVTLIEIRMHLIRVKPGHISYLQDLTYLQTMKYDYIRPNTLLSMVLAMQMFKGAYLWDDPKKDH